MPFFYFALSLKATTADLSDILGRSKSNLFHDNLFLSARIPMSYAAISDNPVHGITKSI